MKVDWRGALRGANCVKTYFVIYRESSGPAQQWDARRVEGRTEADLYGLKASQSYMVRVAALAVERGGDGCCFAEGVPQNSQEVEFVTGQVGENCWPYEEELPDFEGPPTVEEVKVKTLHLNVLRLSDLKNTGLPHDGASELGSSPPAMDSHVWGLH